MNVHSYSGVGETSQMGGQMSNSSHEINRRPGMPPPYPNNPQLQMLFPCPNLSLNSNPRVSHYRSLSHSSVFDSLPPLSPTNPLSVSFVDPNLTNVSVMGERAGNSQHGLLNPSLVNRVNASNGIEMMPPRKRHQRSFSETPMGFSAMINQSSPQLMPIGRSRGASSDVEETGDDLVSSYLNLENIDASNGCESSDKKAGNREINVTSMGFQFQGASSSVPRGRSGGRKRTFSMDNAAMQTRVDQLSTDEKLDKFGSKFNEAQLKKVLAEDKLVQLALSNPKRVKRILANRESAARSKLNSAKKVAKLEQEIRTKETELAEMSANQSEQMKLASKYNELMFHIQAIDQQAQQRYELHRLQHSVKEMSSNTNMMDRDIDRMDREMDRIDHGVAEMHLPDLMAQQLFINNENLQSLNHHQQQNGPQPEQFQEEQPPNESDIPEAKR
ncbi:hypothetical protein LWI28_000474 [Acer negundo]|uniref:BZIP domain-containing protein n=1 Tax=Acer negundo TaxID=4023 RepID=A0AAD5P572_ACENE|nr:hypothetical protein LWI28_000474 [Acer negundo]